MGIRNFLNRQTRTEEDLMRLANERQAQRMTECAGAVEGLSPVAAFSFLASMVAALSYNVTEAEWTLALDRARSVLPLLAVPKAPVVKEALDPSGRNTAVSCT